MRLIIHGENLVRSRHYLSQQKTLLNSPGRQRELVSLSGQKISLNSLIQATEAKSLFGSERVVIIENLFRHPAKSELSKLLHHLSQIKSTTEHILIWENKSLSAPQLHKLPNFTATVFKISSETFKFIDAFYPGNGLQYLPLFDKACLEDSAEFVFFMLVRQVRMLLVISSSSKQIPPWQVVKIKSLRKRYTESQLVILHDRLTDLDWRAKSGQTVGTFKEELKPILIMDSER